MTARAGKKQCTRYEEGGDSCDTRSPADASAPPEPVKVSIQDVGEFVGAFVRASLPPLVRLPERIYHHLLQPDQRSWGYPLLKLPTDSLPVPMGQTFTFRYSV